MAVSSAKRRIERINDVRGFLLRKRHRGYDLDGVTRRGRGCEAFACLG